MTRALAVVLWVAALAACGATEQPLAGRWQSEEGGYINQLELSADGTYSGTLQRRSAVGGLESAGHYSGRWKLRSGTFSGQVLVSDASPLAVGYVWSDNLVELNKDSMVLRSSSAHETTWQRLP